MSILDFIHGMFSIFFFNGVTVKTDNWRLVAMRDSGELEFYYRRISAVKQCKPLQSSQLKKLEFFRVSPGAHLLTKKPEDSGYEID